MHVLCATRPAGRLHLHARYQARLMGAEVCACQVWRQRRLGWSQDAARLEKLSSPIQIVSPDGSRLKKSRYLARYSSSSSFRLEPIVICQVSAG